MAFDTIIQVRELPWAGITKDFSKEHITSSEEIIKKADLDWQVEALRMKTDLHDRVLNYHAIYRTDTKEVLGAVNTYRPQIVQNVDMFNTVEHMIGNHLHAETAAGFDRGVKVFGCFKIQDKYKILDDEIDHYFVIVNDHLRPDGKVTILNTPVRIVCQNTLTAALSNNLYKMRIPVVGDAEIYASVCERILERAGNSITYLTDKAETLYGKKVDSKYLDTVMDVLFPYQMVDGYPADSKANESMSLCRETFINDYMGADDLGNYRGTQYQIMQACIDWDEHAFKKADKAYDLGYRMSRMPAFNSGAAPLMISQFMKIKDKIAA